jgi:hypothetical protein
LVPHQRKKPGVSVTPGFLVIALDSGWPEVTCATDTALSPDVVRRRSYRFAYRDLAVWKSLHFPDHWQPNKDRRICIYRLDAAHTEMVHTKIKIATGLHTRRGNRPFYSRHPKLFCNDPSAAVPLAPALHQSKPTTTTLHTGEPAPGTTKQRKNTRPTTIVM